MDEKPEPDVAHLTWAIDQRAKIQHTLLALYAYAKKTFPDDTNSAHELLLDSLIGASFALWRAVFLAEKPVTDRALRQAQTDFLATVVSTNTITFNDDRKNSAWSLGFYMTTASNRVLSAFALAEMVDPNFSQQETMSRLVFYSDQTVRNTRRMWESLHSAVRVLFNVLSLDDKLTVEAPSEFDHYL